MSILLSQTPFEQPRPLSHGVQDTNWGLLLPQQNSLSAPEISADSLQLLPWGPWIHSQLWACPSLVLLWDGNAEIRKWSWYFVLKILSTGRSSKREKSFLDMHDPWGLGHPLSHCALRRRRISPAISAPVWALTPSGLQSFLLGA